MLDILLDALIVLALVVWLSVLAAVFKNKPDTKEELIRPISEEKSSHSEKQIIMRKINVMLLKEPNLQVEDIKRLLSMNHIDEAKQQLDEIILKYEKFKQLNSELTDINDKLGSLTNRLADGKVNSEAYTKASDTLEQNKKYLEEKLWKLRNTLFKDSYEKPF